MDERLGANHYGEGRRESGSEKAGRIVREEMKSRRWTENGLRLLGKGDDGKIAVARRLRGETTMTLKWIAARPAMGTWTYVSNLLAANQRDKPAPKNRSGNENCH